ncbi:MAG: hypothetical protein K2N38_02315 [Oscillospiraceae bacterium]|nr:hypothetical protein [Oscillospiraceae bacterium]
MNDARRNNGRHLIMHFGNQVLPDSQDKQQISAMVPVPKPPKQLMNTIAETAKLCRERNMGLNDSTLRYLCKSGALPCLRVGNKTLINWNVLIRCLFSDEPITAEKSELPKEETGIIRPVPARLRR